jgi:hypothetical protein
MRSGEPPTRTFNPEESHAIEKLLSAEWSLPMTDHREACRRRHRIVANWLALYTWKLRADCIVLDRDDLGALLSVSHIKEVRKE